MSAYSNGTASAGPAEVNVVRKANGGEASQCEQTRPACALTAVTVAVENACAASCQALAKEGQ